MLMIIFYKYSVVAPTVDAHICHISSAERSSVYRRHSTYMNFRNAKLQSHHVALVHFQLAQMMYDEWKSKRLNAKWPPTIGQWFIWILFQLKRDWDKSEIRKVKRSENDMVFVVSVFFSHGKRAVELVLRITNQLSSVSAFTHRADTIRESFEYNFKLT